MDSTVWIKLCKDTPAKMELSEVADMTGRSDDEVLGIFVRLLIWLDGQTADGRLSRISLERMSKSANVPIDFLQAMTSDVVRWLTVLPPHEENWWGIIVSNYERHNGQSAKKRTLTAKRQARFRATRKGQ